MEGGWQGEEEDWIPDTSSPPLPKSSSFSGIFHSLRSSRELLSQTGISTSGEGRDFSEIVAVFLTRNKRVYTTVASWGGSWRGCRGKCGGEVPGIFPFQP